VEARWENCGWLAFHTAIEKSFKMEEEEEKGGKKEGI
jgi:hypothetical protein